MSTPRSQPFARTAVAVLPALALSALAHSAPVPGTQDPVDVQDLPSLGSSANAYFGLTQRVAGGVLVVAAPNHVAQVNTNGAVFVYERAGHDWVHVQTLDGDPPQFNQQFGLDVDTNGEDIFVHANRNDASVVPNETGAVHVFRRLNGTWTRVQVLYDATAPAQADNRYGWSLVTAPGSDRLILMDGTDRIVEYTNLGGTWTETGDLVVADLPPEFLQAWGDPAKIGSELALDGDRLVSGLGLQASAVLTFERDLQGWHADQVLTSPFGTLFSRASLALEDDVLAIGMPTHQDSRGAVRTYVHDGQDWVATHLLQAPDGEAGDVFGEDLALRDGRLVVTARLDDVDGVVDRGSLHGFERSGPGGSNWAYRGAWSPSGTTFATTVGMQVSLDGGHLVVSDACGSTQCVGGLLALELATDLGFPHEAANPNSTGQAARLRAAGAPALDAGALDLALDRLPAGQPGYFLMSANQEHVPLFGGSQGVLALGAPLVRFSQDVLVAPPSGALTFAPDLGALPQGVQFAGGETWTFQYWFRDANPGPTSNTSNALALTFETAGVPTLQFPESVRARGEEEGAFTVRLSLSQPVPYPVTVDVTPGGSALHGLDWQYVSEPTVNFAPGTTTRDLEVYLFNDTDPEGPEQIELTLSNPSGATLGALFVQIVRLTDDD